MRSRGWAGPPERRRPQPADVAGSTGRQIERPTPGGPPVRSNSPKSRTSLAVVLFGVLVAGCSGSTPAANGSGGTPHPTDSVAASPTIALTPGPTPAPSAIAGWSLVALGDSIVSEGYPQLFADLIEKQTGKAVSVASFADGSNTTATVLASLRGQAQVRTAIEGADIVTISVGGNDADPFATYPAGTCAKGGKASACLARYAPDLGVNFEAILTEIEKLRAGKPTLIRPTSDYNPFIGWDAAPTPTFGLDFYRQVEDAETDLVCALATKHGLVCADIYHAFNGSDGTTDAAPFLASDHAHPSAAGSQRIAETLLGGGLAPLTP